jgi:D-serine deaminase-like pyridoxal phosphate-dependent protein
MATADGGAGPRVVADLATPALLLDLDVLEANLRRMQERCDRLGVALRPHAKTPKCVEVARRQRALGARGFTVSTLHEAEALAAAGFDDLTWAFPLVPSRLAQARSLAERVTLRLLVDGEEAVAALAAAGFPFHVFLEVDCGDHRSGVDPASPRAVELARRLAEDPVLVFDGLLTHSGHAYRAASREAARAVAEEERWVMAELADRLRREGVPVAVVSVGSTPAMAVVEDLTGATEARPGNYAFHDGTQAALGSCGLADCALTVLATVVSAQPGAAHSVIDAGALALSKDPGPTHLPGGPPWALGAVFADLAAYRAGRASRRHRVTGLSQEHGVVSGRLPVGSRLRVLPNHSCLAVPNFPAYQVVRGEEVVDRWPIFGGRD